MCVRRRQLANNTIGAAVQRVHSASYIEILAVNRNWLIFEFVFKIKNLLAMSQGMLHYCKRGNFCVQKNSHCKHLQCLNFVDSYMYVHIKNNLHFKLLIHHQQF